MEKNVEKNVEKIIKIIEENSNVTMDDIAQIIGMSRRSVEDKIRTLKMSGIISRIGPDKGGKWIVNKQ